MTVKLLRTDSTNPHFIELVKQLDAELAVRDGAEHAFYAQFNTTNALAHVVVLYENGRAVACGALKAYAPHVVEIKRMYTAAERRGKGLAFKVLAELETWAAELSCKKCVLETGVRQPEAIALYLKSGYTRIPNYGQYAGVENSLCFEKVI